MLKRGTIKCLTAEGWIECAGQISNSQWGIHLDPFLDKGKHYVLTHLPSGKRVWSSRTQMTLKRLIQEPEFLEPLDDKNIEQVNRLSKAIKRFCDASPRGWE